MNDKTLTPENAPPTAAGRAENQWVMVFNVLTRTGKEDTKKTYKVNKRRVVIGSALSSDIRIQQNAVSNVHAVVEMDEKGQVRIYDMASETGVFLNDKKALSEELKDGDEIKIGFATLTFKRQAVQEAQNQAPASAIRSTLSGRKLFYDAQEDFRPLILEDERNVIQIFDYPTANEQSLQVVMYWGDVILDVKHIVEQKPVTLGETKEATFLVPGLVTEFPLVSFDGAVALQFTKEMGGVVRTGHQLIPLNEIQGGRFHLKQSDMAKIKIGDIAFYVCYAPLPPHLRRQRVLERDPLYFRIWFTSIAFTLALVALFVGIEPKEKLETEELPPRVANIIFKPDPVKPPPPKPVPKPPVAEVKPPEPVKPPPPPPKPPKPVVAKKPVEPPKVAPKVKTTPSEAPVQAANQVKGQPARTSGGNAGEGARAAGTEGRKGAPNKPKSATPMYAGRGNPNANKPSKSQVQGPGNVEALFSDIGGSISKNLAAGSAGTSAAASRLKGRGAFTTEGNGGLGVTGAGTGGGGTSQTVEGLGTKGLGDGASGKGLGAIGSGGNLAGTGHGRPVIEVGNASETIIMGGLDKSLIDEIIKRHMAQIRYCYTKELNASKTPFSGRVLTRFVISGSGRVTQAGVDSSSLGNANVERCLTQNVLKNIVFPEPVGGGIVEVSYPFSFTPSVMGQ